MLFRVMQYSIAHHQTMRDGDNGRCTYQDYKGRLLFISNVNSDNGKVNINKLRR